jgi:lysozyme
MNLARLSAQLSTDEGRKPRIYLDTATPPKWTGGVGRNLTDNGFSQDEIDLMLSNDIVKATSTARSLVPGFDQLDDVRQEVIVNWAFNLGYTRLSGFKMALAAISASNWDEAATQMLNSKWATQVGARAQRLASAMKTGVFQ